MARQRSSTRDDYDRLKDANHKLRADNRKLRKENATLKKELNRYSDIQFDIQLENEEEDAPEELIAVAIDDDKVEDEPQTCPKCHSEHFTQIPAGQFVINVCRAPKCMYRQRIKRKGYAT